ncbi:MAG: hypothetical protein ACI81O_001619 [Cyclobacteriaceae bacterium]|jgi:hypothetical protein
MIPAASKVGIEVELMAPSNSSRLSLAQAMATACSGQVQVFFFPQAEPAKSSSGAAFQNLTQGFRVTDGAGRKVAELVDDLTLQRDCDKQHLPQPGWYRIVSNDARLLNLVQQHCDPAAVPAVLLEPIAKLFGTKPTEQGGMIRVADIDDSPVVMLAPLPGERHRPCELISAPIDGQFESTIAGLLAPAHDLGFTLAAEAATHLHFDGTLLRSSRVIARLIQFFNHFEKALRARVLTNPLNRRLASLPSTLVTMAGEANFQNAAWDQARQRMLDAGVSKYADVNFLNLARDDKRKPTLEVRMIGPSMSPRWLTQQMEFFAEVLRWSLGTQPMPLQLESF